MATLYTRMFNALRTPQSEPIPGAKTPQVKNSAGGYAWAVDDWTRLDRFLILGSEGGTYYASAMALTRDNARSALRCVQADGPRTVARIVEISRAGRAPKNDPAIFALAMALKMGDDDTRRAARDAVPAVCRIGTHLFQLAESVKAFGGWGRGTRRAFAQWYTDGDPARLAYQAVKYQSRGGWSHRDVLRKVHARASDPERDAIFRWMVRGWEGDLPESAPDGALRQIWGFERLRRAETPAEAVALIGEFDLPRECVPTKLLNSVEVWDALLSAGRGMPLTATLRNLGKMTSVGLLTAGGDAAKAVVERLGDAEVLRRARIHPLAVLVALTTYQAGRGVRGKLSWRPVQSVVDALDRAFYLSFGNVQSTNRRWMLALDVSGSMSSGRIAGLPGISPRVGSAAMALVTANTEEHLFTAFSHKMVPLDISPRQRLDDVVRAVSGLPFGGTDCALPMVYARKNKLKVDVFTVYTDSETWFNQTLHPAQALREYRQKMGIPAKLIVVGLTASKITIADPDDSGMLDVVGFDTASPEIMRQHAIA